jgi:preprotein translocase subunit YajC
VQLLILVAMLALTWVLFVRPQQQRLKRQKELVQSLGPGDRVVTAGGMIGTITAVRPGDIDVELSPGLSVRMLPGAVTRRWTEPDDAGAGAPGHPDEDRVLDAGDHHDDHDHDHDLDAGSHPGPGTGPIAPDPDERGPAA